MAKEIEYIVDDTFPDLSKFDGMTKEELQQEIKYLEEQAKLDAEKCKGMSREEQSAYLKCREIENERYLEQMRQKRKNQLETA